MYNSGQDSTVTRWSFVFLPDGAGLFDPLAVSLLHELPVDEEQGLVAGACNYGCLCETLLADRSAKQVKQKCVLGVCQLGLFGCFSVLRLKRR